MKAIIGHRYRWEWLHATRRRIPLRTISPFVVSDFQLGDKFLYVLKYGFRNWNSSLSKGRNSIEHFCCFSSHFLLSLHLFRCTAWHRARETHGIECHYMAFLRILLSRQLIPIKTLMKIGLIMSMKTKLLAIVGSHRKNGNCYALAKSILDSTSSKFRIIQLAIKKSWFGAR